MNHEDAMKLLATERYTLDEMELAERDAFEEHFFECSVCAADVRDAAKFAAGVRTGEPAPVPIPFPRRFNWSTLAASILAVLLSYQTFRVIPRMAAQAHTATTSLAATIALESASRGANEQIVKVVHGDEAIALMFPIETDEPRPFYICEVRDAAGKTRASRSVPREKASEPVMMVLAPHTLPSGLYKLVIRGGDREIAAYPFTVEVR